MSSRVSVRVQRLAQKLLLPQERQFSKKKRSGFNRDKSSNNKSFILNKEEKNSKQK
jgi:hypothetical protein